MSKHVFYGDYSPNSTENIEFSKKIEKLSHGFCDDNVRILILMVRY